MGHVFVTAELPETGALTLTNTGQSFSELVTANPDLRIERTAQGEVVVMAPAHSRSGLQNAALTAALKVWSDRDRRGRAFDSSTGYDLPNGANRSPDASWVLKSRLDKLTPDQREGYLPLAPDFVVELRSQSDRLNTLKAKMEEYMANGSRLGWLIDPVSRNVFVYRPQQQILEVLSAPSALRGEPELPGFELELEEIWNPGF